MRPFVIKLILAGFSAALLSGCGASTIPAVHSEAERLAVARRLMAQGQCGTSIELLKTYIENNGGSADVDQAIYLLGECYLRTKDWTAASIEFERLLRDYPESDSSGSASFRLGEATFGQARPPDFDQEHTLKALNQWQSYLRAYPEHWLNAEAERKVALARRRLATKLLNTGRLYYKLKLHEPARVYFERVAEEYGDLDVVGDAWLGLALVEATKGKKVQAIARLKEIEERFPGQSIAARAAHERARLER